MRNLHRRRIQYYTDNISSLNINDYTYLILRLIIVNINDVPNINEISSNAHPKTLVKFINTTKETIRELKNCKIFKLLSENLLDTPLQVDDEVGALAIDDNIFKPTSSPLSILANKNNITLDNTTYVILVIECCILFINGAPIIWWSKRQNTVESSTIGSEYVALRIGIEQIIALRFKLFHLGIKVEDPADVFCDNEAVVNNSSVPASVLSKRHNAICYHRVRESAAAGMVRVAHIKGDSNPADLFTKLLPDVKRKWMVKFLTGGNEWIKLSPINFFKCRLYIQPPRIKYQFQVSVTPEICKYMKYLVNISIPFP